MIADTKPSSPGLIWYIASAITLFITGSISKIFLALAWRVETHGFEKFLELLRKREDVAKRTQGLVTVANHISTVDDPFMWGLLPYKYLLPQNCRWALGSYDICYTINNFFSTYFMLGQTLPTHRLRYSEHGGLFQPSITQCIRLLGPCGDVRPTPCHPDWQPEHETLRRSVEEMFHPMLSDPYYNSDDGISDLDIGHTYTTTGTDLFQSPSSYTSYRHAWLHVFPEGRINQDPDLHMNYFRWGVARLILESEPCPMVVPMWIEGTDQIKHESVQRFRMVPRIFGKKVTVIFGEPVCESVWKHYRRRWKTLVQREMRKEASAELVQNVATTDFLNDELRCGKEAQKLRIEVANVVREQVLELRRARGWPDEQAEKSDDLNGVDGYTPKRIDSAIETDDTWT